MKVDRIVYQKIFPTGLAYLNQRIGVEIQVEEGDNYDECFRGAKAIVEQWNLESNPSYAMAMEYMKPSEEAGWKPITGTSMAGSEKTKDERIQSFIATINMCTNKKFLENFRKRVDEEHNQELYDAFNNKLKSFE